jgi:uncharacterized membrane protein YraQ (UPF0718 family)
LPAHCHFVRHEDGSDKAPRLSARIVVVSIESLVHRLVASHPTIDADRLIPEITLVDRISRTLSRPRRLSLACGYSSEVTVAPGATKATPTRRTKVSLLLWANLAVLFVYQGSIHLWVRAPAARNWSTVFMATVLQALPFLLLGVAVGAAITAFVPPMAVARALPRRPLLAVPAAGLAGAVLPGCECSAAPVANRLVARGVEPAAALTFLLAAPAINPIVLVSTAVAFRGNPQMVWARFSASFIAAVVVGFVWARWAKAGWLRSTAEEHVHAARLDTFVATATTDFVQAGGFLVIGAALVATLQTLVPDGFPGGGSGPIAVLSLAALAVVLSVCSEADAFIAAGLTQFSLTARLAFLVVGPMIDVKLIALQVGVFGKAFAARFSPLVFCVAVLVSVVVGQVLL